MPTINLSEECLAALTRLQRLSVPQDVQLRLYDEQESLLTAQTELTQHLVRFVEEQLARAERAEGQLQEVNHELDSLWRKFNLGHTVAGESLSPASLVTVLRDFIALVVAERDEANAQWQIGGQAIAENTQLTERAERAEAENERLMAALEVEKAWWEGRRRLGNGPLYTTTIEERLEALSAALENPK